MDLGLVGGGLLLGFGGSLHCAAMCGGPCAALTRGGRAPLAGFHVGRALSYMAVGAIAAASVSSLAAARESWPLLRMVWTVLHVGVLVLGGWLLATGRVPEWRFGRAPAVLAGAGAGAGAVAGGDGWMPMNGPGRSAAVGLAWAAWPCGLLQSAVLLAALANSPVGGAAVMGAFALGSLPALAAGPLVIRRLAGERGRVWSVRLSGLMLLAASGWALGHGLWEPIAAWCGL